jgi:hypothetical protein
MLALRTMRIPAAKMIFLFCGPNAKACFQIDTSIASLDANPSNIRGLHDEKGGPSSESEACLRSHVGSKLRTAAKDETTGYARAFRRAFDWQQRCRLR